MQQFAPPPSLTDGLVTIRPWRGDDAEALVSRINDPDVAVFLDMIPQPYTPADAREWFTVAEEGWRAGTSANFAIQVDGIEGAAGGIGVRFLSDLDEGCAEVGYWVGAEARGRGVATTATRTVARWAFEAVPALARLQLRADVQNVASNRVAEKAGFKREGVLRAQRLNARLGRRVDFVMWSLLREELRAAPRITACGPRA
jgi:RimJ/RimL family protein N-acetyltransferase